MKDTPWDHGLKVTAGGEGLVGHAGAVLLRKLADLWGSGTRPPVLTWASMRPACTR